MTNDDLLSTMFAVHGKRPMDAQFNEYLKIFDHLGNDKAVKVFRHVRDREDKFPTIKQLWGIIDGLGLRNKKQSFLTDYEDCYYCGGVGYIPYLISPKRDKRVTNYNTEVYACDCSAGQDVPKNVQRYFTAFKHLQFSNKKEGYNYPQLVNSKQREYSNKLYEENNHGRAYTRGNQRDIDSLEEGNLRQELERITSRDTED